MNATAILIGSGLALAVAAFARVFGLDRDRAFYPVVLIVVASYYVLFAVMAGGDDLAAEFAAFAMFAAAAIAGFRLSLWIAAAGLAAHGVFDFLRVGLIEGRGVPTWWPDFCFAYDVVAGAVLATMLFAERRRRAPR